MYIPKDVLSNQNSLRDEYLPVTNRYTNNNNMDFGT